MKTSSSINEIATALSKMQAALEPAKRDAKGYNYKYATLSQVWDIIRMPLIENGLSVIQDAHTTDAGISVTTRIMHNSGQWIECGPMIVPVAKKDAQGAGSATTYGRRYSLCAALGVSFIDEDDDGQAACSTTITNDSEMVKLFLEKWSGDFGKDALIAFIKDRATHLKVKERPVVKMYLQNEPGFRKDFDIWLSKQNFSEEEQ